MADNRQTTIYDVLERRAEEELAAGQTVSTTKAVRCPGCGQWCFDERKVKVCGLCGRRFTQTEGR